STSAPPNSWWPPIAASMRCVNSSAPTRSPISRSQASCVRSARARSTSSAAPASTGPTRCRCRSSWRWTRWPSRTAWTPFPAPAAGRHRGIGLDLVNHCVNDIATAGARPLFFLDYFAAGQLEAEVFTAVMEGLAEACQTNGCALLGGETAEMPGVYDLGDYDLAGFVVGLVEEAGPRPAVCAGDLLIGLPSSGLHTNGFSLVRRIFQGVPLDHVFPELGRPLADELLEPHRSYLAELQAQDWKAAAHITGGGLTGNLPR